MWAALLHECCQPCKNYGHVSVTKHQGMTNVKVTQLKGIKYEILRKICQPLKVR